MPCQRSRRRARARRQQRRRHPRLHIGRAEPVEAVAVAPAPPGVARPAPRGEDRVGVAVEEQGRPVAVLDAREHVRAVALGGLELGRQPLLPEPGGHLALHRALLAGVAAPRDEPRRERRRFLQVGLRRQPGRIDRRHALPSLAVARIPAARRSAPPIGLPRAQCTRRHDRSQHGLLVVLLYSRARAEGHDIAPALRPGPLQHRRGASYQSRRRRSRRRHSAGGCVWLRLPRSAPSALLWPLVRPGRFPGASATRRARARPRRARTPPPRRAGAARRSSPPAARCARAVD